MRILSTGTCQDREAFRSTHKEDPLVGSVTKQTPVVRATSRLWIGVLFLALLTAIFMSGCTQFSAKQPETPLEIDNISIEPIDDSTVRIGWSTNKETLGGVYLVEPDKETLTQESPQLRSKSHSVTIGGLPPGPDHVFEIGAEFYGPDGFSEQYAHKRVVFRMP